MVRQNFPIVTVAYLWSFWSGGGRGGGGTQSTLRISVQDFKRHVVSGRQFGDRPESTWVTDGTTPFVCCM